MLNNFFDRNRNTNRSSRRLGLESLENRELLSVSPLGTPPEIRTAAVVQTPLETQTNRDDTVVNDLVVQSIATPDGFNDNDFQKLYAAGLIDENGDTFVGTITWNDDIEKQVIVIDVSDQELIGSLDVSGCTALTVLTCSYNKLTSLDLSGLTALTSLNCSNNQLTSLDVTGLTALTSLYCSNNQLTSLDVTGLTALTRFYCSNNQLTSLDVSSLTALVDLACGNKQLASLDLSVNMSLQYLSIEGSSLSYTNVTLPIGFSGYRSNHAYEIGDGEITDANFSGLQSLHNYGGGNTTYTWYVYPYYVEPDHHLSTQINSSLITNNDGVFSFHHSLAGKRVYCVVENNAYSDWSIVTDTVLIVSSTVPYNSKEQTLVDSVKSTADFKHEWVYDSYSNQMRLYYFELLNTDTPVTSLDFSDFDCLAGLNLWHVGLETLDVSGCTALTTLDCSDNALTALDLTSLTSLTTLYCSGNALTFATLPVFTGTYDYSNQANIDLGLQIPLTDFDGLAAQFDAGGGTTTYTWYDSNGNVVSNYAENDGVFSFAEELAGKTVYCEMTNTTFSGLTLRTENVVIDDTGITYNANDQDKVMDAGLENYAYWEIIGGEYRLTAIYADHADLSGELDLSGCTELTELNCSWNNLVSLNVSGCTALASLRCSFNSLTSLDVSNNTALTLLDCNGNQLSSLDVSANTALVDLYCSDNQLTDLDVSNNTALMSLGCASNRLTVLDVSENTALLILACEGNRLTSLDMSGCEALLKLDCYNNQLTSLNLSDCTSLWELYCNSNQLSSLDLSDCTALVYVSCYENQLTFASLILPDGFSGTLDVGYSYPEIGTDGVIARKNYDELSSYYVSDGSTNYTWYVKDIEIDPDDYPESHVIDSSLIQNVNGVFSFDDSLAGRTVYCKISNSNFPGWEVQTYEVKIDHSDIAYNATEKAMVDYLYTFEVVEEYGDYTYTNVYIDWVYDSVKEEMRLARAEVFNTETAIPSLDFSGYDHLVSLSLYNVGLGELEVSGCTALRYLECTLNNLTSLDCSGLALLEMIYCERNQLTDLDVSGCFSLLDLTCAGNKLSSIDVSDNTNLESLYIGGVYWSYDYESGGMPTYIPIGNYITTLDLTGLTELEYLNVSNNRLTSLDLSDCTSLYYFDCSGNRFTFATLPVVSSVNDYVYSPQQAVDIGWQISLTDFDGLSAQFDAGGGVTNYTWYDTSGNIISDCTEIDGLFSFDASLNGTSVYCVITNNAFPDLTLETEVALINDGSILINEFEKNLVDLQGLTQYSQWEEIDGIARLVGINAGRAGLSGEIDLSGCTELRTVYLYDNEISSLDLTGCTKLETVSCFNNELTELLLSAKDSLETLHCYNNQLQSLDLSDCTALTILKCDENALTELNLSGCTALTNLACDNNQLTSLDLSDNTGLTSLTCGYNKLESLDLDALALLGYLECSNNELTVLTFSSLAKFTYFSCGANRLTELDLSGQDLLRVLYTCENQLTSLNASGCSALTTLYTCDNQLTSLDVSGCSSLETLLCCNNELTTLSVEDLDNLYVLNCSNNRLEELNLSGCTSLSSLDCYENLLVSLDLSTNTNLSSVDCYNNRLEMLIGAENVTGELICYGNNFKFSTLPVIENIWYYVYADNISGNTQAPVSVDVVDNQVDLSSEFSIHGVLTEYTWYYEDGSAVESGKITDLGGGLFQFEAGLDGNRVYCEMTNSTFPELTLKTVVLDVGSIKFETPVNLRLAASAQTTLSLDWNDADGASEYILQRKGPGETVFTQVYKGAESKYVDRGLTAGTSYEYRVQAVGSKFSDVFSVSTTPAQIDGEDVVDSPMIMEAGYDAMENRNTIIWTDLGPDYIYTVYKSGRIVVNGGADAFYEDPDPAASGTDGYTVQAYNTKLREYSTVMTAVLHSTAPVVEVTGVEFLENGSVKLLWDTQPGMLYMIMQAGRSISGTEYLESGEWIDTNPDDSKEYLLVTLYKDSDGILQPTFSNLFSVKRPVQAQPAADAFWGEYGALEESDLFL